MEIKKPVVGICTQKEHGDSTILDSSLRKYGFCGAYAISNTTALSKIYNRMIEAALAANSDCLILVHDDVILEEDPIPKLEKLFDQFDLVGVAGTKKIDLKSPCLWHLMGGGFQSGNLHGLVQHLDEVGVKHPTDFGPVPQRVVMIDGVFMALNRKCMNTIRFDESNPAGFHFYDLDFSLNAHMSGLKVGVGDILITHASPGLREFTPEWISGDKWFLSKYAE